MEAIFWIIVIAVFFDGIKMMVESFTSHKGWKYRFAKGRTTVIVAAHNEEDIIVDTVASIAASIPEKDIIVVDDESTDDTVLRLLQSAFQGRVISIKHAGKVGAIHAVLSKVKTPYILLLDADIRLGRDFVLPTDLLDKDVATAVTFNVIPEKNGVTFWQRFWIAIQRHEYAKSMQIGKRFHNQTKSVHCISGAGGLFRTDRLKELSKKHSGIFPGEDLERTLIELNAEGRIVFCPQTIYTDVPKSFWELSKQRIFGWWPGLWRNMWKFAKLLIKPSASFRLRWEMLYEVVSLLLDPIKIVSLVALVLGGYWDLLLGIYSIYFILEGIVYFRIFKLENNYLDMYALVMLTYPFYSVLNMVYRLLAFFVFLFKISFSKDWKKIAVACLLVCMCSSATAKDWTLGSSYSYVQDVQRDRNYNHYTIDFGYNNVYIGGVYGAWKSVNAGMYFKYGLVDLRVRDTDIMPALTGEYWIGDFVPTASFAYMWQYKAIDGFDRAAYPVASVGGSYYSEQGSTYIGYTKEWGRSYGSTLLLRHKQVYADWWGLAGVTRTSFGKFGGFGQVGYGWFYLHGAYYQDFDFTSFDRYFVGAGVMVKL